jgi:translation initiation factor 4E
MDYEKAVKKVGSFGTVEEFWRLHNHMVRINDLPCSINLHLFRSGIKPVWEVRD